MSRVGTQRLLEVFGVETNDPFPDEVCELLATQAVALAADALAHARAAPGGEALADPATAAAWVEQVRLQIASLTEPPDRAAFEQRRSAGARLARLGVEPGTSLIAAAFLSARLGELVEGLPAAATGLPVSRLARRVLLDAYALAEGATSVGRGLPLAERLLRDERARSIENATSVAALVAGLAHEMGTPLGVIQGHAELLESAVSGDAAIWRLRTIQDQIGRISRTIQSLLGMARPRRASPLPAGVAALLESALGMLTSEFERRGIQVHRSFETVPSLKVDPERVKQLFLNLLRNAAEAMPDGGDLELRVAAAARDGLPGVEVTLRDSGPGIPEADADCVFAPFYTTKAAGEGNGLGLAEARHIVEEHGGRIGLSSASPSGACFHVWFPSGA